MYVSDPSDLPPAEFPIELDRKAFDELDRLGIKYITVTNDSITTMKECPEIDEKLDVVVSKSIFVCNRQKTDYYLVIMPPDKRFNTKKFSQLMHCSRVSFASGEDMEDKLGVSPGSATVMCVLNDTSQKVRVVIDKDVADSEWFGCNTGSNTIHIKFKTRALLDIFLPANRHDADIILL